MPAATQRIEGLIRPLAPPKPKIGLDTNCVKYYLSNPPVQPWADCLDPIIQAGLAGDVDLYVSTVVVSELLSHAHYANRHRTGYDPELALFAILDRHFEILDVNQDVARAAGRLRGNHIPGGKISLKTPDALIAGTSLANGHTVLVTNDAQLSEALPPTNCIYLRDVALEWLPKHFPAPCFVRPDAVKLRIRGAGLPNHSSLASYELGALKPDPSAKWERILAQAFTVAAALNEACVFFVLTAPNGRKTETQEVLFWHQGLEQTRPVKQVIKRLWDHIGFVPRTGAITNPRHRIHVFHFTSISRERGRQTHPMFVSRKDHQREAAALEAYLKPLWLFREAFQRAQTECLLCEDGTARMLDSTTVLRFLECAANVLGWKEEQP